MRLKSIHLCVLSLFVLFSTFITKAEDSCLYNTIFDSSFSTLKIERSDNFYAPPIIELNSDQQIVISFDQFSDDVNYLQYRLIHCDAYWQQSSLLESEYIDGFNIANVDDYGMSTNTFIHYVNYRIALPNNDLKPTISGNYIVQVFYEHEPDTPILQARFSICNTKVDIIAEASSLTDKSINDRYQQLNFEIDYSEYLIRNPYNDIKITVSQNSRTDNIKTAIKPLRISNNKLIYEHISNLIFDSGNEFRRFETVRANYPGMGVDSTRYKNDCYNAFLSTDMSRADEPYLYDQTQNGRFFIDEYNSTDPNLGADYIDTKFTLNFPEIMNADIYVDGEFTHHQFLQKNKMIYNHTTHCYELTLRLKQGSYNYQYLTLPNGTTQADLQPIEGNHYETINEYLICVYHRQPGDRSDSLIGYKQLYSHK